MRSGSEYMVGLLSLPEQIHLVAVLRSFNHAPNYFGVNRWKLQAIVDRKGGGGDGIAPTIKLFAQIYI